MKNFGELFKQYRILAEFSSLSSFADAFAEKGYFVSVNQEVISKIRLLLKETEGIDVCYAAATALTSAQELYKRGWVDPEEIVLVNLTGSMHRPKLLNKDTKI